MTKILISCGISVLLWSTVLASPVITESQSQKPPTAMPEFNPALIAVGDYFSCGEEVGYFAVVMKNERDVFYFIVAGPTLDPTPFGYYDGTTLILDYAGKGLAAFSGKAQDGEAPCSALGMAIQQRGAK